MTRLLILACSATKRPDPGYIPAIDRYDGPLWRTLRTADPAGARAKVAVLSALHGFRAASTPIDLYNVRLTRDLADRMIAGGVTTRWPRPASSSGPDTCGMHAGAEIAGLTRYGDAPVTDLALVGGALYVEVMHALVRGFVEMGCVHRRARVSVINAPIGRMRQELRSWLLAADVAPGVRS